jgi:hypothetical protein
VVVVGYPNVFPSPSQSEGRHAVLHLSPTERQTLRDTATRMDTSVAASAKAAGLPYVSTLTTLGGHEMYTATPWVVAICDRTVTCLPTYLKYDQSAAHLNEAGQRAVATMVARALTP